MRVVALIAGQPQGAELWTLWRLASDGCSCLDVIQGRTDNQVPRVERLRSYVRQFGAAKTASLFTSKCLAEKWEENRRRRMLDELFDTQYLHEWWMRARIHRIEVPDLNHPEVYAAIAGIGPDLIVNLSREALKRDIFSLARRGTLNIRHGRMPYIKGICSFASGIIERRHERICAAVQIDDGGADTSDVLWSGHPQIAPGDTYVSLFFRAHIEAVEALCNIICQYAGGDTPSRVSVCRADPNLFEYGCGFGK